MKRKMKELENTSDLEVYFRKQTDICFCSELFGDLINEHGSKVLMLFAEIYSFMVQEFGLKLAPQIIIDYSNSKIFKEWFWTIKHRLGENLHHDPTFDEIGKWIGRGFFLKIIISIIIFSEKKINDYKHYNNVSEKIKRLIFRQQRLLNVLLRCNYFTKQGSSAIEIIKDGYLLLGEKTVLNFETGFFYSNNVIRPLEWKIKS